MRSTDDIKRHLVDIFQEAEASGDVAAALSVMMERYCDTGVQRACVCETRSIELSECSGEWFIPPNAYLNKRIVYLHGGGWLGGSVNTHRHLIDQIALAAGAPVFAPNYRLAPEHPFPAGLRDCEEAFRWAASKDPTGRDFPAERVYLMGDSAGGNLTAGVTIRAIEKKLLMPNAVVLLSPVTDFRPPAAPPLGIHAAKMSDKNYADIPILYLQNNAAVDDPYVSPAAATTDILEKFPPALIQIGSDERLRDQCVDFAAQLWEQNVSVHLSVWPNMPHVFQLFPEELSCARRAIREIAEFIE